MNDLIEIENIISQAKKKGVDFGKGDPYNRLRYYTKIGWLPHMERKKDKKGNVKGHYPPWALERLIYIEELKAQGLTNEEIQKKLDSKNKVQSLTNFVKSKDTRNQLISAVSLLMLVFIFSNELGIIRLGKVKNLDLTAQISNAPNQVMNAGTAFVPKGLKKVFVRNNNIRFDSKVYVVFKNDYTPAQRFWVESIEDQDGFTVQLDAPVADNAEFDWWSTR